MTLHGTRIAILVEDLYQDLEVWYPYYRFKEAGAEVVIVGTGKPEYKGKYGYPIKADAAADAVAASQFDAILVPGGYAPDLLRRFPAVLRLVQDAHRQGKIIGAICHAGWVLCSAGILRGKTVIKTWLACFTFCCRGVLEVPEFLSGSGGIQDIRAVIKIKGTRDFRVRHLNHNIRKTPLKCVRIKKLIVPNA